MKKTLLILSVVFFTAAGVYAEGRREDPFASSRNTVTLTGTLQFANGFPAISADGKTYNIFAPRLMREAYTLKPGIALTVEGYMVQPGPMMRKGAEENKTRIGESIFVRKVTIDGKTFETGGSGKGEFRRHGHQDLRSGDRGHGRQGLRGHGNQGFSGKSYGYGDRGPGKDSGGRPERKWNSR